MKLLRLSLKDPSERGRGDLPFYGRLVKFLRRILGLKDPLEDGRSASLRPSLVERLDDIFAHDRTRLNEVLPEDIETTSSSEQGPIQAPVHAELDSLRDSLKENSLSTELSAGSQAETGEPLQTVTADAKESLGMPAEAMTVNSIALAAEEAAARLRAAHQEMETSLESRAEVHRKRLAELSSDIEGLADELEKTAKELLNRSAKQLQEQADATVAALDEELKASRQGFIDETKKQLTSMTQASLESLTKATAEQARTQFSQMLNEYLAKGLRELEAEHRELLKKQVEAIRKQIDDFSKVRSRARPEEHRGGFTRVEHAPRRQVGGRRTGLKVGLGVAATALILVGIYASRLSVIRLQAEPPAGFIEERPDWSAKRRAREEQLARAYWERAVRDVQAKYKFGTNLPDEPPAEFTVEEKGLSGSSPKVDPGARARYWVKLRQFWVLPETWEKSSRWNTDWIRRALQSPSKGQRTGLSTNSQGRYG